MGKSKNELKVIDVRPRLGDKGFRLEDYLSPDMIVWATAAAQAYDRLVARRNRLLWTALIASGLLNVGQAAAFIKLAIIHYSNG